MCILNANIFWFLPFFCLLISIFFQVSESESFNSQNQPARKRKKPALNRPVRKRKKPEKLIEAETLLSDDEESNFAAGLIIKKAKKDKKG